MVIIIRSIVTDYMSAPENQPKATRGIILLDTSAIIRFLQPAENQFLNEQGKWNLLSGVKSKPCLMDAVVMLAKNGYEVVIPEMISYESGRTLKDGSSTDELFGNSHSRWSAHTQKFLKSIAHNHNDNGDIHIVAPFANDDSDAARHIRTVAAIRHGSEDDAQKRRAVRNLPSTAGKEYGTQSAVAWLKHTPKPSVPVFYISENPAAMNEFLSTGKARNIDVGILNPPGFYDAMRTNGLLHQTGMDEAQSHDAFFRSLEDGIAQQKLSSKRVMDADDLKRITTNQSIDTDDFIGSKTATRPFQPFAQGLAGLGASIDADAPPATLAAPDSPMEKFRKREQKRVAGGGHNVQ